MQHSPGTLHEVDLSKITIGKAQVRTEVTGIDELAQSIRKQGLLQPIVVVAMEDGRFEVIAGQRRFLACQQLEHSSIRAVVIDSAEVKDDEAIRVAISLTENLVRKDNRQKELIDACTKLYKRYGSMKLVAEETGLSHNVVSKYVKYDQLAPPLKELVDSAQLDMKVALQAQKAATDDTGELDQEAAIKFAQELKPLGGVQRENFVNTVRAHGGESLEERIEAGKKQPVLKQVLVTLEASIHGKLQEYAKGEGLNQDEAASSLLQDSLARRGLLEQ